MNAFVKPLLRIAKLQGRAVIEALVTGQFSVIENGGKIMTQASAANKSFAFTIPQGHTTRDIMLAADDALAWLDSHTTDELDSFLARRASSVAIARFY